MDSVYFLKKFLRQGTLLGYFLCDRVQDVERFATHPRHFPNQVAPSGYLESEKSDLVLLNR